MTPPLLLDGLPPEVIQEIALRVCETPFLGPPTGLVALLALSRRTHAALCAQHNPTFHARVFRAKFDTRAPERRFGDAGQPLTATSYAVELRRRWMALRRIRHISNVGKLTACSEEDERADLWLIYLMFLESDGKNFEQLVHWAAVSGYVRAVIREQLIPTARPGYPIESTSRALGLWLMWFLTQVHAVVAEPSTDTAQMHHMLRPWALASHKFDTLYAPYTHWSLPTPDAPAVGEDPIIQTPHLLADLDLRDRTEIVIHMGRRIHLAPPRASLAAIMAFMVRLERNGPIPPHPAPGIPTPESQFPPTVPQGHPGLTVYPRTRYPAWYGPGSTEFDGRTNRKGSAAYDPEWRRGLQCGNPFAAPRIKIQPTFVPGDLAGDWEGRFVFLTFDAFRDMLAGFMPAVLSGPIAQQPHVWRIREHHCIHRRRRVPTGRDDQLVAEKLPVGNPLDAFIPADAEFIQHGGEPTGSGANGRHLEVRLPDPTSSDGFKSYRYATVDGPTDLPQHNAPAATVVSPIPPSMDLDPDWDNAVYGSEWPAGDDEWEEQVVDTIITGEGHSSWGAFNLRGRVRAWDGMIVLVKDYAGPDNAGRGRWLYKGYIVAGGNWVGRWRDTFTAERLNGYEGVFNVTRRFQV